MVADVYLNLWTTWTRSKGLDRLDMAKFSGERAKKKRTEKKRGRKKRAEKKRAKKKRAEGKRREKKKKEKNKSKNLLRLFLVFWRRCSNTALKPARRLAQLSAAGITSSTIVYYFIMRISLFVVETMSVSFALDLFLRLPRFEYGFIPPVVPLS